MLLSHPLKIAGCSSDNRHYRSHAVSRRGSRRGVSTINRGIYAAATGMLAQQRVQDALASNLANINTAGYKQDVATFRELAEMAIKRFGADSASATPIGRIGLGAVFDANVTDMSTGAIVSTGNPLDLALSGDGLFAVQTAAGERYTRAGQFQLQPAGKTTDGKPIAAVTDDSGNALIGSKGPIRITDPRGVTVSPDGSIMSGGAVVDRIKIVSAAQGAVTKTGGSLFEATGAVRASTATVRSGAIEQSNVNPIRSMVRMITVQRAYDAAQRAVVAQDDTLGKAVNELPRR